MRESLETGIWDGMIEVRSCNVYNIQIYTYLNSMCCIDVIYSVDLIDER
jgi:hypothetical protein